MKKLLSIILCVVLVLGCAACKGDDKTNGDKVSSTPAGATVSTPQSSASGVTSQDGKFTLTAAKIPTSFKNKGNVILCWGDSITEGMKMAEGYTYPDQLQGNIGDQYQVINAGVPTERTSAIMSRANAIDVALTEDMVFAAGQASVTLDCYMFSTGSETIEYFGFGNDLKMDTVKIGNQTFKVTYQGTQSKNDGKYTFTRSDASSALTLKKGTKVTFDYSSQFQNDYCNIILMGANDNEFEKNIPAWIEKYRTMANLSDKYIIIVPFHYDVSYKEQFEAAFGNHVVNVREYFIDGALKDYGLQPHKRDEKYNVTISNTLTYAPNDCHLSENGYKILADMVYKKGVELGYWK